MFLWTEPIFVQFIYNRYTELAHSCFYGQSQFLFSLYIIDTLNGSFIFLWTEPTFVQFIYNRYTELAHSCFYGQSQFLFSLYIICTLNWLIHIFMDRANFCSVYI